MPAKKYLRKKAEKLCLIGEIVSESHSFLEHCQNCIKSTCVNHGIEEYEMQCKF